MPSIITKCSLQTSQQPTQQQLITKEQIKKKLYNIKDLLKLNLLTDNLENQLSQTLDHLKYNQEIINQAQDSLYDLQQFSNKVNTRFYAYLDEIDSVKRRASDDLMETQYFNPHNCYLFKDLVFWYQQYESQQAKK